MSRSPIIDAEEHKDLGLTLLSFEAENADRIMLGLVPENGILFGVGIEPLVHVLDAIVHGFEEKGIPVERFPFTIPQWPWGKRAVDGFAMSIKHRSRELLGQVTLVEYGTQYVFFAYGEGHCVEANKCRDALARRGWAFYGKRWVSWVAEALQIVPCDFVLIPEEEAGEHGRLIYAGVRPAAAQGLARKIEELLRETGDI
jgi:hypothetical protein